MFFRKVDFWFYLCFSCHPKTEDTNSWSKNIYYKLKWRMCGANWARYNKHFRHTWYHVILKKLALNDFEHVFHCLDGSNVAQNLSHVVVVVVVVRHCNFKRASRFDTLKPLASPFYFSFYRGDTVSYTVHLDKSFSLSSACVLVHELPRGRSFQ